MATPTNGSGNLVDEFEEAFQSCLNVLTKEEAVPNIDKEEVRVEVDQTTLRFIDLARQMEAFFLQKRFLLSALKPELVVKEDTNELRIELNRKEDLLKRHYEKIAVWQNLLADLQAYKSPGQGMANGAPAVAPPPPGQMPQAGMVPTNPLVMQQMQQQQVQQQVQQQQLQQVQMQQQLLQQQQQQVQQQQVQQQQQAQMQQHLQQQMQVAGGLNGGPGGMVSPQQALFMQQQGMAGPRGPFGQGPGAVLQGPLAYLEKTTSNIGMTDGRR